MWLGLLTGPQEAELYRFSSYIEPGGIMSKGSESSGQEFFNSEIAAARYDLYRPDVQGIVIEWLRQCVGDIRFERALDVACGTGDSTVPLARISDSVLGIDSSSAMLKYARDKGLQVRPISYRELHEVSEFNLISVCMAYHWFDPVEALRIFKRISAEGAIWIIYNFYFTGHETSSEFNQWLLGDYLDAFPTPPRNKSYGAIPTGDPQVSLLKESRGNIQLEFTIDELIGYLTTQTNIEYAISQGRSYDEVSRELKGHIEKMNTEGYFKYRFEYEIFQYDSC